MLIIYTSDRKTLVKHESPSEVPAGAIWIDMFDPTPAEEAIVERALKIDVPTREEMKAIEISNRLYKDGDALFMTATMIAGTDTDSPHSVPVTFILEDHKLISVRYHEHKAFGFFETRLHRMAHKITHAEDIFVDLLEMIVDRLSSPLEDMSVNIDALSQEILQSGAANKGKSPDFNKFLRAIGRKGDLNSKVKEALVSLDRLVTFLSFNIQNPERLKDRLQSIEQDIHAMTDHANFLSNKFNFLLDATLGMISIEQNSIIKFFSVAAVIFLPPTLIASIYGMNFSHMPELDWIYAYPATIVAMLMSAILPYVYFRHRGWL